MGVRKNKRSEARSGCLPVVWVLNWFHKTNFRCTAQVVPQEEWSRHQLNIEESDTGTQAASRILCFQVHLFR
jgi:hypothetical protein